MEYFNVTHKKTLVSLVILAIDKDHAKNEYLRHAHPTTTPGDLKARKLNPKKNGSK